MQNSHCLSKKLRQTTHVYIILRPKEANLNPIINGIESFLILIRSVTDLPLSPKVMGTGVKEAAIVPTQFIGGQEPRLRCSDIMIV